jgi:hypothetical protein
MERFFRRFNRLMDDDKTLLAIGLLALAYMIWGR